MGTPVVAALVGGVPSMVRDGETALCFPTGDEIVMAECLRMLFAIPHWPSSWQRRVERLHNNAIILQRYRK